MHLNSTQMANNSKLMLQRCRDMIVTIIASLWCNCIRRPKGISDQNPSKSDPLSPHNVVLYPNSWPCFIIFLLDVWYSHFCQKLFTNQLRGSEPHISVLWPWNPILPQLIDQPSLYMDRPQHDVSIESILTLDGYSSFTKYFCLTTGLHFSFSGYAGHHWRLHWGC